MPTGQCGGSSSSAEIFSSLGEVCATVRKTSQSRTWGCSPNSTCNQPEDVLQILRAVILIIWYNTHKMTDWYQVPRKCTAALRCPSSSHALVEFWEIPQCTSHHNWEPLYRTPGSYATEAIRVMEDQSHRLGILRIWYLNANGILEGDLGIAEGYSGWGEQWKGKCVFC